MSSRAALALALALAGCDNTVFPTPFPKFEDNWVGIQQFCLYSCASCHDGDTAATVFPDVLQTDVLDGTGIYVVPGDSSASLFWRVISDADRGSGDPVMPFLSLPQDDGEIDFVDEWITRGAPVDPIEGP